MKALTNVWEIIVSISPKMTDEAVEAEEDGPTFRLTVDQYHRIKEEEIILDRVELLDGHIHRKEVVAWPPSEWYYRFTVDQYRAMARLGIINSEDRVELLEGWLVAKMTKFRPHVVCARRTWVAISELLPDGWYATKEDPVLAFDSEPEPDVSVVKGDDLDYLERTPGPLQVPLVVEVADSSLRQDSRIKKRLYARSGFAIYWLINLVNLRIEVYTDPTGPVENPDYLTRQDFGPDDMIPVIIGGQQIGLLAVRDLLP